MQDWNSIPVIIRYTTGLFRSLHVLFGVIVWEFLTNLDFDWKILSGKRRPRWTFWVYALCRVLPPVELSLMLTGVNDPHPANCQAFLVGGMSFGAAAFVCASLLMIVRTVAIWEKHYLVITVAAVVWLGNLANLIRTFTTLHAMRDPFLPGCLFVDPSITLSAFVTILATELVILVMMFVGLQKRRMAGSSSGLWRRLYHQGLVWLILAIMTELPAVVFLAINLNPPLDLVFASPAMILMSIGAARMYRGLLNSSEDSIVSSRTGRGVPRKNLTSRSERLIFKRVLRTITFSTNRDIALTPTPSPIRNLEVEIHTAKEEHVDSGEVFDISPLAREEIQFKPQQSATR
ncbi:hypothetical protein OF83DRAFT_152486 [Amylostereum chailletii]|nr:hypothetical protein OF83DRAFT_152486 [Amylostereum chailletii]